MDPNNKGLLPEDLEEEKIPVDSFIEEISAADSMLFSK